MESFKKLKKQGSQVNMSNMNKISILDPEIQEEGGNEKTAKKKPFRPISLLKRYRKTGKKEKEERVSSSKKKKVLISLGAISLILIVFSLVVGLLSYDVYKKARVLEGSLKTLKDSVSQQDIAVIKSELSNTGDSLGELKAAYQKIQWLSGFPFVGKFVDDGKHTLNAAEIALDAGDMFLITIEPYADIIGFTGSNGAGSGEETAEERLQFVIKTLPDVVPKMGELTNKLALIQKEIDYIQPGDYPEKIAGVRVRSELERAIEQFYEMSDFIIRSKPLMDNSRYLLGVDEPRTYLILFQNDKELRPTGGFLTAYSTAIVENGTFKPVYSDDIYNLDGRYTPKLSAPEAYVDYLKGPYAISAKTRLRDINWSPDFPESMNTFLQEAEGLGIDDVDGIIAVDTESLVKLLNALGPVGVPEYGEFSTEIVPECDCPQVIYELESFADIEGPVVWSENEPGKIVFAPANMDNRKKIIGPLMNSILANALGAEKDKIPALFTAMIEALMEKHVLVYMLDGSVQQAVEEFGIAGKIEDYQDGVDYLHINDANLGGRKSNLYVTQEVAQEVTISKDGTVQKTLSITYNNPVEYDGWLNSVLPNFVRVYVPKGSELISVSGFEDKFDPYDDLEKTVYSGFFELRPLGISKVVIDYKLPFKVDDEYRLFVQKQPGTNQPLYAITVDGNEDEFYLKTDKKLEYEI